MDTSLAVKRNNIGGEIIAGLPCVKRLNQLFCGTSGDSYPREAIDRFVDENKALLRRMYGELQEPRTMSTGRMVRTLAEDTRSGAIQE